MLTQGDREEVRASSVLQLTERLARLNQPSGGRMSEFGGFLVFLWVLTGCAWLGVAWAGASPAIILALGLAGFPTFFAITGAVAHVRGNRNEQSRAQDLKWAIRQELLLREAASSVE